MNPNLPDLPGHQLPGPHTVTITDHTTTTDDGAHLTITLHHPNPTPTHPLPPNQPLIILTHGWASNHTIWHTTAHLLATAGHTVATYDHRGHGTSTNGTHPTTLQRLAHDLDTITTTLSPHHPITLLAHSGGGYTALTWATHLHTTHPTPHTRLTALILAATAAHNQQTPTQELKLMQSKTFTKALKTPWLGRLLLKKTHHPHTPKHTQETNRRLFANTHPHTRATYFNTTQTMDHRPHLPHITTPTLIITGTHDKIINPTHSHTLHHTIPHTHLITIPNTGHTLPLETPHHLAHHTHQFT
ncbi:alpha/beta fold hydrolase, partial [Kitasatospora sp. NPDC087861]|uniref:alpha/beta fold hydrolase n=1 Tax=Kitasatospora sp. NPDC087861 TaxID=3364070 RepID=UPI0037FF8208